MEVLDHRQFADLAIVEDHHPGGYLAELRLDAGLQPSFARDELVAIIDGADDDGLQDTVLADRLGERGDLLGIEDTPRLERIRVDPGDQKPLEVGRLERSGLGSSLLRSEQ